MKSYRDNLRNCETCIDDYSGNCKFDISVSRTSTQNRCTQRGLRRRFTRLCGCVSYAATPVDRLCARIRESPAAECGR